MDYEEPAQDFFDDDFWGNWYDEMPVDDLLLEETPANEI